MTQPPGYSDPNSAEQYGQPNQPSTGGYPDSGSAGYGQPAQPGYGQSAQPGYGQQGGYPTAPPAGYGDSSQRRPGMVTAAAVIAFVVAGLGILGNLAIFTLSSAELDSLGVSSGFYRVLAIVGLILCALFIWGAVLALQGKSFVILLAACAASILLNVITMVVAGFTPLALLSLVLPILMIAFLVSSAAKAWIKSRGGATLG